ncbi:MAG: sulfite exporter TauE/SafE family protein [Flavobacteriales bacterium]|nr:sulfite exporter TauE/SafE family protein [Flavobacteriales bacterium]
MSILTIITLLLIGVIAGILSGMIGIGGGIVIVPALVFFVGLSQLTAQGTSLAIMLPPVGFMAVYNYHKAGNLEWKYALLISLAFVVGGYIGSKLSIDIFSESMVKKIFGMVLLVVAFKLVFIDK